MSCSGDIAQVYHLNRSRIFPFKVQCVGVAVPTQGGRWFGPNHKLWRSPAVIVLPWHGVNQA